MTQFEKIKVEQIADMISGTEDRCNFCAYCTENCNDIYCVDGILEFLRSEVENNE